MFIFVNDIDEGIDGRMLLSSLAMTHSHLKFDELVPDLASQLRIKATVKKLTVSCSV